MKTPVFLAKTVPLLSSNISLKHLKFKFLTETVISLFVQWRKHVVFIIMPAVKWFALNIVMVWIN